MLLCRQTFTEQPCPGCAVMPSPLDRAWRIWLGGHLTKHLPVEHHLGRWSAYGSVISPFAPWCVIYDCDSLVYFQSLQASTNGFGKGDFNARSSAVVRNSTAEELVAAWPLTNILISVRQTIDKLNFRSSLTGGARLMMYFRVRMLQCTTRRFVAY